MGTSHLVMGELTDYLTGQILPDTHDERILQKISRFLLESKGYFKTDIRTREKLSVTVLGKTGTVTVHFIVHINDISFAVIIYGPGSIVTRQRGTLAVARLFKDYVIPCSMITNGTEAIVMDSATGNVIGKDMDSFFSRGAAVNRLKNLSLATLTKDRREMEQRILYTMDILTEAECNNYVCKIP